MRLVTTRDGLQVKLHSGFVLVDDLASRNAVRVLRQIPDLGELLRRGHAAWDALVEAVDHAQKDASSFVGQPLESLRVCPPVLSPSKIICVGHNYRAHVEEGKQQMPSEPLLFCKTPNTLLAHDEPIRYPSVTGALDYEGELAIVVSKTARAIPRSKAMDYVAGFTIFNDVSARDLQHSVSQWFRGKSLDTFGPTGPVLTTGNEAGAIGDLLIETRVNGEVRQSASCRDMIFPVAELIEFISDGITLAPGDLIATGTPAGVGASYRPPRYLAIGDLVEVSITGLGTLRSPVAGA